jgi:uncharacterized protein YggE
MRRILLAAVAAVLTMATPGMAAAQAPAQDSTPTLSVVGLGSAFVTPDTADIGAAVTRTAPTRAVAREDVARRTRDLLAALDRLGIARSDVQTTGVSISRETRKRPPRVRFTAQASLSVHLTDVALVGPVFDALTAARADDLSGPSFSFSSPTAGRAQAEQAALADARARADAAAAAMGMRVVGVRSINLDPGQGGGPIADGSPSASAGAPAKETPTPIEAGRQQVLAAVAVVFVLASA